MIPWKRFWIPIGGTISCGENGQGFLDDPEDTFGRHANPAVCELSTLLDRSPLILCGEPGIGKSVALNAIRDLLAKRLPSHDNLFWIEFRTIPDTGIFLRRTIETDAWNNWQNSSTILTLVIDGVDEGLIKIPEFVSFLTAELARFDLNRLQLILACRTAEWPTSAGKELIGLWPADDRARVYELCPLRQADARAAAQELSVEPDRFLEAVYQSSTIGLAARPITLFFLLREFSQTGAFPGTHRDLYEIGCARLCAEEDAGRVEILRRLYPMHRAPTTAQLRQTASRIAALLMLTGRFAVHTGSREQTNPNDLHISEIAIGTETANSESFQINDFVVLQTLATGLFTSRGEDRFGFAHQTFAECLGAKYLETAPSIQVTQMVCQRDGPEQHIVPQLAELAAWLAGGHPDFLVRLLESEPEILLRSDVARLNDSHKHDLIASLFARVLKEEAFDIKGSRRFYRGFNHPNLAAQLSPIIRDKASNIVARRMALEIAGACQLAALAPDIFALLDDVNDEPALKRFAASALADLIPEERLNELLPLAQREIITDEDYEVKAAALEALIPRVLKVREAIPFLSDPSNDHYFGAYWAFLHYHVPRNIEPDDIPSLLEWIAKQPACFDTLSWFKEIADATLVEAAKRLNDNRIAALLVTVWLTKARAYEPLPSDDFEFVKVLAQHPQRRQTLIRTLLESNETTEHDVMHLFGTDATLFHADDLAWTLDNIRSAPAISRPKWVVAIEHLAHSAELTHCWDQFLATAFLRVT